jgi:hypothetical protein
MANKKIRIFLIVMGLFTIAVTALPYFILSNYCTPVTDDFLYAAKSRDLGVIGASRMWYFSFTGRYTSSLLMSLLPIHELNFGIARLFPAFLIVALLSSFYYLINSFRFFSQLQVLLLTAIIFPVYLSTLANPGEVIFWLAGSITYTLPFIIFLMVWGYVVRLYYKNVTADYFSLTLLTLGCIALSGSNEIMIFYHGFIVTSFFILTFKNKSPLHKLATVMLIVSITFSLTSLLAPGNFGRQLYMTKITHSQPSIVHNIKFTVKVIGIWLYLRNKRMAFIFMIVGIMSILMSVQNDNYLRKDFRLHPIWIALFFFSGHLLTYLPVTISRTEYYPDRTLDAIYSTYMLFAVITIIYTALYYKIEKLEISKSHYLIFMTGLLGVVSILSDSKTNTVKAYKSVLKGEHITYKKAIDQRFKTLYNNRNKSLLKVNPLKIKPLPMVFSDVDTILHGVNNFGYEIYFNIDTVVSTTTAK